MSTPNLCLVCSSVGLQRDDFERPPFEPEGRYQSTVLTGTLGQVRSTVKQCSLCRLILCALSMNEGYTLDHQNGDREWEMIWSQHNSEYDLDGSGLGEDSFGSGLYPTLKIEDSHTDHCIQLVDEASTKGFLRGRMIPNTISAEMIQSWMQRCEQLHGEDCKRSYLQIAPSPALAMDFMVIDVIKRCLVSMPSGAKYVALSYVWGQANHVTTVKSNLSEFRCEGAFSRKTLPRTIEDTIDLSRALGFQYLWVDALCIVQDEGESKQLLIASMDAVYGNAALTIVAASGKDADTGLSGWKTTSPERPLFTESMGPGWRLGVLPAFEATLMNSPHARRAWTHQEGCLSPRCLVILGGKAFFSCRESIWREDIMAEIEGVWPMEGANTLGRTPSLWALRRYSQTVSAYTTRQLTYQSDILNAFTGISKAMTSSMASTRMFYALPAVAFDWAILWTGHLTSKNLRRYLDFPSWAWVGWKGEILMGGDTYGSLDHQWLLERTWIEWYITLENGEVVLLWDPEQDKTLVSTLTKESDAASHGSQEALDMKQTMEDDIEGDNDETRNADVERRTEEDSQKDKTEDEDESDDEEEVEVCPTYGTPSSDNLYGRMLSPELLTVLPGQPDPSERIPHRSCSFPGTLHFSTVIINLKMDIESSTTTRGFIFKLRDSADQVCGFIWEDSERTSSRKPTQQTREILILSQASPGTLSAMKSDEVGLAEEYQERKTQEEAMEATAEDVEVDGESILGDWHSWDFFNVMLPMSINEDGKDNLYERDGIGLLHKNALAHGLGPKPAWKMVQLR